MTSSTDEADPEALALYDALVTVAGASGATTLSFAAIARAGGAAAVFPGDDDGVDTDRVESVAASLIADGHVTRRGEAGWAAVRRPGTAAGLSAQDPDLEPLEDEEVREDTDEAWEDADGTADADQADQDDSDEEDEPFDDEPEPAPPAPRARVAPGSSTPAPAAKKKAAARKAPARASAAKAAAPARRAAPAKKKAPAATPARSTSTTDARTGSTPVSSTPRKASARTSPARKAAPRRSGAGAPTADALAGPLASLLSEVDEQVSAVTELTGRIDELVTELNDARADQAARWAALAQLRKVAYDAGLGEAIDPRLAAPLPEVVEQDFPTLG